MLLDCTGHNLPQYTGYPLWCSLSFYFLCASFPFIAPLAFVGIIQPRVHTVCVIYQAILRVSVLALRTISLVRTFLTRSGARFASCSSCATAGSDFLSVCSVHKDMSEGGRTRAAASVCNTSVRLRLVCTKADEPTKLTPKQPLPNRGSRAAAEHLTSMRCQFGRRNVQPLLSIVRKLCICFDRNFLLLAGRPIFGIFEVFRDL